MDGGDAGGTRWGFWRPLVYSTEFGGMRGEDEDDEDGDEKFRRR